MIRFQSPIKRLFSTVQDLDVFENENQMIRILRRFDKFGTKSDCRRYWIKALDRLLYATSLMRVNGENLTKQLIRNE